MKLPDLSLAKSRRPVLAVITILALGAAGICGALAWSTDHTRRLARAQAARLMQPHSASTPASVSIPAPAPAPDAPKRAPPAAPAPAAGQRRLDIAWDDGDGRMLRTRITLDGTSVAQVETAGDGRPLVAYRGTVRRGGDGTVVIAANPGPASGPAATEWLPDSFTVRGDGSVIVDDGTHPPCRGYLAQESEQQPER